MVTLPPGHGMSGGLAGELPPTLLENAARLRGTFALPPHSPPSAQPAGSIPHAELHPAVDHLRGGIYVLPPTGPLIRGVAAVTPRLRLTLLGAGAMNSPRYPPAGLAWP